MRHWLLGLMLSGCYSPDLVTARFRCSSDVDCPGGQSCIVGHCAPLGADLAGSVELGGPDQASLSRFWMRDRPERPLDFCSLAALADVFYPRVFLRRAFRVPAGTVSMTVYFHAGAEMLRAVGSDFVLGQARGQFYHAGYFDQTAQLWSRSGAPLASSTQVVYYKE